MARPKEFEPDQALERAIEVFWHKGFDATSIQDLVDAMGINRGSLYDTFGDKKTLFLKAFDRYCEQVRQLFLDLLSQPEPALSLVERWLDAVVTWACDDELRKGCLITNAAVELSPHCEETGRRIAANLEAVRGTLEEVLARGQAEGDVVSDEAPAVQARFLLGLTEGLLVLSKVQRDPAALREITGVALRALRASG